MDTSAYITALAKYCSVIAIVLAALFLIGLLIVLFIKFLNRRYLKGRDMVWLELTPPASVAKTPDATVQLFSVIHGFRAARHIKERLLKRAPVVSFEISSTKADGIRYLIQVERSHSSSLQKAITAYVPDAKVVVAKYEPQQIDESIEFRQRNHYVLPLTLARAFDQHDPLAYITSAMTKLSEDEQVTLQLIVAPVKLAEAIRLSRRILGNEDILRRVQSGRLSRLHSLGNVFGGAMLGITEAVGDVYNGSTSSHYQNKASKDAAFQAQVQKRQRPARTLSAFELELMESMHQKLTQPLFQVDLRVLITSNYSKDHTMALRSAIDAYSVPPYQELRAKTRLPIIDKYRKSLASRRLPSMLQKHSLILSAAEVASLYHFPSSKVSKTDNLVTSLSRTLPAPLSLKKSTDFDVIIGRNYHHSTKTPIGMTEKERERHMYIIGGTGNGKTTLLQYAIVQDMKNGKGLAVVDPHGDMAETLLTHVPEHRLDDVVYLNPDDLDNPIGLNLLELTPDLTGNALLREKDLITESVISVFRKIFSEEDTGGHRIEYVLRNAIHTALTVEGATLFTVLKLLQNASFRKKVTGSLEDEDLRDFWKNELGQAGNMQRVKMSAGITAKIGRFNSNAAAKLMLDQEKSTIDFDDIINSGKILICNFSKGLLGEDVSELFGITVLAKLQLASLRRARLKQDERRPFHLYVDEFQNFATASFVQMLSESRKYKLFMTMAEQSTSQQKDQQMVSVILANVGTVICFRTGNPNDERLLLPLFSPYIEQGEIANLSAFNFYARLSSVFAQEPLSGQTLLLDDRGSNEVAERVIAASRKAYAVRPKPKAAEKPKEPTPAKPSVKRAKKQPTKGNQKAKVKIPGG